MQLSLSQHGYVKVHRKGGDICTKGKSCQAKHVHLDTLALKSTYTEGWTVNDNTKITALFNHGFSCWQYIPTTREKILKSGRAKSVNHIDYTNGYRTTDTAVALLSTHWLDYDENLISIEDMAELWEKHLPSIGVILMPSSSGKGIRFLYESTNTSDETLTAGYGQQILLEELAYISSTLNITLDKTKTDPSAHSGHLELQGTYKIGEKVYSPEFPTYPPHIIIKGGSLDLTVDYKPNQQKKTKKAIVVSSYNDEAFNTKNAPTTIVFNEDITAYTMPANFIFNTEEGSITTAELYLKCISRADHEHTSTASPIKDIENSRLESTFWYYNTELQLLQGKEKGQGKGEHASQDKERTYCVPYAPIVVSVMPKDATEVADNHFLLGNELYRVVSIGTQLGNVIEDHAHSLDLDLLADIFPIIAQSDKGFFLIPHNPYLNIDGAYTIGDLITHLYHANIRIVETHIVFPEDKTDREESVPLLSALNTFLKANAPMVTSLTTEFTLDTAKTGATLDAESRELLITEPYHSINEPSSPRPDNVDWYYTFARDHQSMDIKALATMIVAKARNALPAGVRVAVWYNNGTTGVGKSVYEEAYMEIGLAPRVEMTEYLQDGGNGKPISYYGRYLFNSLDEANKYEKVIPDFVRLATSKGISGRVIYGMTEKTRINFIGVSTHQGIRGYDPEFMDEQDIDRVAKWVSKDRRKFSELTKEETPYDVATMKAMLAWALYDSFTHALDTIQEGIPVDFDFSPYMEDSNITALTTVSLDIICGGIDKLKNEKCYIDSSGVFGHATSEDGLLFTNKSYSQAKKGDHTYLDGLYWNKDGLHIDCIDVVYKFVEDEGLSRALLPLIKQNEREVKGNLGITHPKRKQVTVAGENFRVMATIPFTTQQLKRLIADSPIVNENLKGMNVDELEAIYKKASRTNLNAKGREQLAEVIMAYYLIKETVVTQPSEEKEVELW